MKWSHRGDNYRCGHFHVYQFVGDGTWCARYWSGFEHEGGDGWLYLTGEFATAKQAKQACKLLSQEIQRRARDDGE